MDFSNRRKSLENNDFILQEILLRLPSESIFKFPFVSRRWNKVITDPCFSELYMATTRLSCSSPHSKLLSFVQCYTKRGPRPYDDRQHRFLLVRGEDFLQKNMRIKIATCVHNRNCTGKFIPCEHGDFITSSKHGLFLSGSELGPDEYYVGNPITGDGEALPPPPPRSVGLESLSIGLSTDDKDTNIINFHVVVAKGSCDVYRNVIDTKVIPIETYSSRTREWRRSRLVSEIPVAIQKNVPPTLSGGFFHWFVTGVKYVVAYDSSLLDEKEDEDRVLQLIPLPENRSSKIIWRSDYGQTIWFGTSNWRDGVKVYRKLDHSDHWSLISKVDSMYTMRKDVLGVTKEDDDMNIQYLCDRHRKKKSRLHFQMVWMVAFIPWDPRRIILRVDDKIYVYDFIKQVNDRVIKCENCRDYNTYQWEWYPYFHPLSELEYNLKSHSQL